MIKLNAQKDNTVKFEIDVSNGEDLQGHFRLVHEGVEYGFPVHIFGNKNKAQVSIPALEKIIPNLKKTAILEARLEFVGNGEYICAWNSKAKVEIPRVQVKVDEEVIVSEKDPGDGSAAAKVKVIEEDTTECVVSTGPFAVSDDAFAAAAEKTKDQGKTYLELFEAKVTKKIKTSTDDAHWHKAEVDDEGDGKTVGTFSIAVKGKKPNPHTHKIVGTEIKNEKGHGHSIV
jgi:hypothetical protein